MITIKIVLNSGKALMMIFMLIKEGYISNKQTGINMSRKIMIMIMIIKMIKNNIIKEDNLTNIKNNTEKINITSITYMKIMIQLKEFIQTHYYHNHTQKYNARAKIAKNLTILEKDTE